MNIKLSPQHGVNPSLGICLFCGKEDGTIVLPGRLRGDREAPRHAVWTIVPCDECQATMSLGIAVLEHNGEHPTGSYVVITEEAAKMLFQPPDIIDQVLLHRKAFMSCEIYEQIFGEYLQEMKNGQ